ncbi:MAG: hypothetical protein ACE5EE_09350 [Fidelibacterota bacterium]
MIQLESRCQVRGKIRRDRVETERRRIFEEGRDEYPQDYRSEEQAKKGPPFYVEIDGTMVPSREEGSTRFEIKAGVMYRGVKKTGKRRRRLVDKVVYSSVEDSKSFGELFYGVCRRHGLDSRCGVEYISDGAGWLRSIAEDVLYEGDVEAFVDTLQSIVSCKDLTLEQQSDLLDYVLWNRDSLDYGKDQRNGSGAVEKNIGIHVGRRFKKQGMRWSREGANNLLALRTEKLNQLGREKFGS